ncbi:hypothetical protein PFISCL1PPCAC_13724, partial [Pristionchus fissidentatus]
QIAAHREAIDYAEEESADFCEAYLREIHMTATNADSSFHEKQLVNVCMDLWTAGVETTAATMAWGVVMLLQHPEVQSALHDELDSIVGIDRLVCMQDRARLPYTSAFIQEVQRWANILPQNLMRNAAKDAVIGGVKIAAGTPVVPQISALMSDHEAFPEPCTFDPTRFLDENGGLRSIPHFLPFSIGKRACLGEGLARMELFLFFANLAHRFNVRLSIYLRLCCVQQIVKFAVK